MHPIAEALHRHWGLGAAAISPLGGGMNSETWLVEHAGSTFVAKRVGPSALDDLSRGCETSALLGDEGLATGRPLPTTEGKLFAPGEALAVLEYVPGRELGGEADDEQRWIAETLARVHCVEGPVQGSGTASFYGWLSPTAPGVAAHPWLGPAIEVVRAGTDAETACWSILHTDPAPQAFRHDDRTGVTGLIDWTGSRRGPVLYDVASVVMYLGGPKPATLFLDTYLARGPLDADELLRIDTYRRFRWAVQAAYFAGRVAAHDLAGVADQSDNQAGLDRARRGLAELGVSVT